MIFSLQSSESIHIDCGSATICVGARRKHHRVQSEVRSCRQCTYRVSGVRACTHTHDAYHPRALTLTHTNINTHKSRHAHSRTHARTHTQTLTHTKHTFTHTHTSTYTHTHSHTNVRSNTHTYHTHCPISLCRFYFYSRIDVPKTLAYTYTPPAQGYTLYAGGFPLNTWAPPYSIGGQLDFSQVGAKTITYMDNYYNGFANPPTYVLYTQAAAQV